jgi:hypothetical protein
MGNAKKPQNKSPDQDLNLGTPKYELIVLPTWAYFVRTKLHVYEKKNSDYLSDCFLLNSLFIIFIVSSFHLLDNFTFVFIYTYIFGTNLSSETE